MTDIPLTFAQEQLWFIDEFHGGLAAHNLPSTIWLRGPLDVAALQRALAGLLTRHEALRTRLVAGADGQPTAVIDPPPHIELDVTDLVDSGSDAASKRLSELASAEAAGVFHLAQDQPFRARLVRLAANEHALLIVVHQCVCDDWSLGVLLRDLAVLYAAQASGRACADLAELPTRFADYAQRERQQLRGPVLADLAGYWAGALADLPTSQFPADRPRPLLASHDGAVESTTINRDLLNGLQELSLRQSTTLPVVLLAALQVLVLRYTGQNDVVIGVASTGRGEPELAPLIGFLANTLPIRADLSGDPAFTELLTRVREASAAAEAHSGLPFAKIVEAVGVERDTGRFPIFQIGFTYSEPVADIESAGVVFHAENVELLASRYDISFAAQVRDDGLAIEVTYTPALFDRVSVRRLLGNLGVLLAGAAADPGARLSRLPVLTGAELRQELTEWNDTATPFPVRCIHQGFQDQAARTPDAVAAECDGQQVTYAELNRQANQIARRLRGLGAGPEILTGVCMTTGLRRLAAILGIWKAGGGYVPLDPALPADRLAFLITDTAMTIILTDHASTSTATTAATRSGAAATTGPGSATPGEPGNDTARPGTTPDTGPGTTPDIGPGTTPDIGPVVLCLDAEWEQIRALDPASPVEVPTTPSNVAYVIYTSGSTGQPKGVIIEHRQAINFLHGMIRAWHITPASAILQFAAFTFDVSVMDMFMPLLAGARVILAPPGTLHSPTRLAALIRDRHITFACLPPAVLALLTGQHFPELRTLLSAGEELTSDLLRGWLREGLDIYNGYGPTEASIGATFMKLGPTTPLPPPIGRPKPNYRAYVLDEHLNPVPVGVTGELHIGGTGVARGYLNRPGLTASRFIPDPFTPGQRLYKTGDLARRRPDGTIIFAGRIDNQVKVRGLRIELGEIETALLAHPDIAAAVVTVTTTTAGDKQLAAYLCPRPGTTAEPASIRAHLTRTLPAYMIPTHLTTLPALPLTPHGKVDKAALPQPQPQRLAAAVRPATLIETLMVDLYATVLNADQVGATDSFFDLGGSSLLAMRLITMIDTELEVNVGAAAVFLAPTPRQLAALLRDEHGFDDTDLSVDGTDGLMPQGADEEASTVLTPSNNS
jgi:amino acid adenylation domain-containing protein